MIEPVTSRTHPYPKVWVKLAAYCKLAGEEKDAVISRRRRGRWLDGRHTKVVDGHLYVNVPEADRWVEENGR
jgi:hypothetical protein